MTVAVTGATGRLGRLVVEDLLSRGVAPGEIVATGRNAGKLADLAERGVLVREAPFDDRASLDAAFAGATRVLLISGSEAGKRVPQHRNAIDAARDAGAELLAYTSIVNADTTPLMLAEEHKATEEYIRASGLSYALLRNSWYFANYTSQLQAALEQGTIYGAAGDGKISAASHEDFAAAAAAVLTGDVNRNETYELGGDEAFTMPGYAAEVTRQSGKQVEYKDVPQDEYATMLVSFGMPEPVAAVFADADAGIAQGALYTGSGDLSRLTGRKTQTVAEAIAAALPTR